LLVESGLWTYLRTRPFSRSPKPDAEPPSALFVTVADSHPLAAPVDKAIAGFEADFHAGLAAVRSLSAGPTFLCRQRGTALGPGEVSGISVHDFDGPHPAGTVGLHIHTLAPVSRARTVWHLNYQQVATIGRLVRDGVIDETRVVSLCGPQVAVPRLMQTRRGAWIDELVQDQLVPGDNRVISGSALAGRSAVGEVHGFLGAHHNQITVLREGRERVLLGWLGPGFDQFSVTGTFLSQFTPWRRFPLSTTTNGSHRAMVPIGTYENIWPFDILPTFLLRALAVDDVERAEALGILELDEEDISLCTFACPGKDDHETALRRNLEQIWKDG